MLLALSSLQRAVAEAVDRLDPAELVVLERVVDELVVDESAKCRCRAEHVTTEAGDSSATVNQVTVSSATTERLLTRILSWIDASHGDRYLKTGAHTLVCGAWRSGSLRHRGRRSTPRCASSRASGRKVFSRIRDIEEEKHRLIANEAAKYK